MPLLPARFQPTDIPTKLGRKLPSMAEEKAKTAAANAEYEKRRVLQRFESGHHDLHLVAEGIRDHLAEKKARESIEAALLARCPEISASSFLAGSVWLQTTISETGGFHVTELPDSVVNGLGSEPLAKEAARFNDEWTDWIEHDGGGCPIPDAKAGEWHGMRRAAALMTLTAPANLHIWKHGAGLSREYEIVRYRVRKPKSEWGPWIAHKAGPCPIPEAKAGEYVIRWHCSLLDGESDRWCSNSPAARLLGWVSGNITHYRLKA